MSFFFMATFYPWEVISLKKNVFHAHSQIHEQIQITCTMKQNVHTADLIISLDT